MSEPDKNGIADVPASPDVDALIDMLHGLGADRFDPVRLRYVEALARRAKEHGGTVGNVLQAKLVHELTAMTKRIDQAKREATKILDRSLQQYPLAAGELQQAYDAGDFKGLQRIIVTLTSNQQCGALAELVRELEQQSPGPVDIRPEENAGSAPELMTIRNFRNTWSKLSVDKQVAQALEQGPRNAGPINSHMLVLRSLALMREISPDYLNRFMSYTDTLLCLDLIEKEKPANTKKPPTKAARK
ncbi:MAG TPA: DUF2894 domain-containing protein [Noviherbaspirillum sp.]|jgi:hypothetical protein|uniref:DUF2894 domain-containing protein n=1 Tax=Noviherbaspirillum sp. TaxID=1926288 RepID=UPI002DDD005B|nr:DUF2894 domain-containing protein [Noviherbaspirillum sp.]HEV2612084.1 DUF2894 domain-containing protein [Noviherbaspirillum sp.]